MASRAAQPAPGASTSNGTGGGGGGGGSRAQQQQQQQPPSLGAKLWKQTKYCLWGALGTYYLDVPAHLLTVYTYSSFWSSHLVLLSLVFLATTVAIFAYLILLPFRGIAPSYARWSTDPILRTLVPVLTLAIVGGFLSLTLALSPLSAPPRNLSTLAEELTQAAAAAAKSAAAAGADLSSESRSVFQRLSGELSRALRQSAPAASPSTVAGTVAETLKDTGAAATRPLSAIDLSAILRTWRSLSSQDSIDALAARLGIPPARAAEVQQVLGSYTRTVDAWIRGGSAASYSVGGGAGGKVLGSLGWLGAGLGSTATYLLVFGFMGLIGLAAPSPASVRTRAKAKRQ
ncbi:hypothetical protein OC842_000612 [Tilletia horrida]|uniref:Uncharacterized protein n=1 Tax=Tilletia horrida TaxID=155126 RepID=A0AAN6GLK4_9BASI|nr:hypothetical protein OC842_000612 [Tilletia horrida]